MTTPNSQSDALERCRKVRMHERCAVLYCDKKFYRRLTGKSASEPNNRSIECLSRTSVSNTAPMQRMIFLDRRTCRREAKRHPWGRTPHIPDQYTSRNGHISNHGPPCPDHRQFRRERSTYRHPPPTFFQT